MSFWKKLGKVLGAVVAVAAVVFAGPAIAAVAGTIGATSAAGMAAAGALYGAAAGAVAGGLWTGNSSGMAKGAAIGGLIGGAAGAVGVGTQGGAFGSGIGSSGAAPAAAAAPPPAATTPTAAAQTTKGLSSVAIDETTGSAIMQNPTGSLDAASKALPTGAPEIPKVSSALEAAQTTGKYMAYAEGIKLVAGGIAGAAASKERASELEAANAKEEEAKNNRNYQPIYKSNTIFAEKKTPDQKRYFNENGLLNPMPAKVN